MKKFIPLSLILLISIIVTSCTCNSYENQVKNMTPPVKIIKIIDVIENTIVDGELFRAGCGQVTLIDGEGEILKIPSDDGYGVYGKALINTYKVGDIIIKSEPKPESKNIKEKTIKPKNNNEKNVLKRF